LDSGAVSSFISLRLLRLLGYKLSDLTPAAENFVLADQSTFKILGTIDLDIRLNGLVVPFTFTVAQQLVDNCIIGADFLKFAGAQIDFIDEVVHLFEGLITLPLLSGLSAHSLARIAHNTRVPPHSEALIQVVVPPRFVNHDCYLESTPTLGSRGVTLARSLVHPTKTKTVVARLLNPLNSAVSLKARTPLGLITQFNWEDSFNKRSMQIPYESQKLQVNAIRQSPSMGITHAERLTILQDVGLKLQQNELTDSQFQKLSAFLFDNKDLFAADVTELPGSNIAVHHFDTTTEVPVRQKQFRLPPHLEDEMEQQVEKLLKAKIIKPSVSCWNSPVFLIKKPSSKPGETPKYRFLTDLRKLNSIIVPQYYPLPTMEDCAQLIGKVKPKFFSVIDQTSGYYSVPLDEKCAYKTAFTVKNRHFMWARLPMGLASSPACFNFAMATLLKDTLKDFGLVYLDDLVLMSPDFEHHIDLMSRVFAKFRETGLRMNAAKCMFATERVKYLGFIISNKGMFIDDSRVEAIRTFPTPTDLKTLRQFLGIAQFFKRFIKGFSSIAFPLRLLLTKGQPWTWGPTQNQAFLELKNALCSAPVLQFPDPEKHFYLACDASKHGFGACLMQKDENDQLRPVAYAGRATRNYEKNYSASELELASLCYSVLHFYQFIAATKFTVLSDHLSLRYLSTLKHGHSRLVRWAVLLSQFTFDVQHVAGKNMGHVDGLSRRSYPEEPDDAPPVFDTEPAYLAAIGAMADLFDTVQSENTCNAIKCKQASRHRRKQMTKQKQKTDMENISCKNTVQTDETVQKSNKSHENVNVHSRQALINLGPDGPSPAPSVPPTTSSGNRLRDVVPITFEQQTKSPSFANIIAYITQGVLPKDKATAIMVLLKSEQYTIEDGLLVHLGINRQKRLKELRPIIHQVCVPEEHRIQLLEATHLETLHSGVDKTYFTLKTYFWWPSMYTDTKEYVKTCSRCYEMKPDKHFRKVPLHSLPVPGLFSRLHVDHIGPLKVAHAGKASHKYKYVLVLLDALSLTCELVAVETTTAVETATAIYREWILRYSVPQEILSDRGQAFGAAVSEALYSKFGIKHIKTSGYHPETNSKLERQNQTIAQGLRVFSDQQAEWPTLLPTIRFAHMVTISRALGCSPFYALYKQEPRLGTFHNAVPQGTKSQEVTNFLNSMETEFSILRQMLKENTEDAQETAAKQYNKTAGITKYQEGQIVYVRNDHTKPGTSKKLQDKFQGPYSISEVHDNDVYSLVHVYTARAYPSRVHANRLRRAHLDRTKLQAKYDSPEDGSTSEDSDTSENDPESWAEVGATADELPSELTGTPDSELPAGGSGLITPFPGTQEKQQNIENFQGKTTDQVTGNEKSTGAEPEITPVTAPSTSQGEELTAPQPVALEPADYKEAVQQATDISSQLQTEQTSSSTQQEIENTDTEATTSQDTQKILSKTQRFAQFCTAKDIVKRKKTGKLIQYYIRLPANNNIEQYAWVTASAIPPSALALYEAERMKKRKKALKSRRLGFAQH